MQCPVGKVEEEGVVAIALNKLNGFVGEPVCEVFAVGAIFHGGAVVRAEVDLGHGLVAADAVIKTFGDGSSFGVIAELPFAHSTAGVSGRFENLWDAGDVGFEGDGIVGWKINVGATNRCFQFHQAGIAFGCTTGGYRFHGGGCTCPT